MCKKVQWSSVLDTFDTGPQRLQQATKSFLSQVSFFCRRSRKLKQFVNHVRQDTGKTDYQRHINKISLNKMLTQPLTLGSLGRHTFQIVVGHTDRHTRLHNSAASTVQWCLKKSKKSLKKTPFLYRLSQPKKFLVPLYGSKLTA